jgi:hypothetical protein
LKKKFLKRDSILGLKIIDPKPLINFFKGVAEKIMGVFEDFGIPEMGFSILGKKFSIGPWYPFRPAEGTTRIGGNEELKTASSDAGGDTSSFKKNTVASGSTGIDKETMRANGMSEEAIARAEERNKDQTRVLTNSEKVDKDGKAVIKEDFATFDPKTGKSMLSGDAAGENGTREITKRAFVKIKANALEGGDNNKIAEIVKEDDAYQKLSFFDKMKVDVGYAKATDLLAVSQPSNADTVTKKSSAVEDAKTAAVSGGGDRTNIVNAPVNNTSQTSNFIKPNIRNQESSNAAYGRRLSNA